MKLEIKDLCMTYPGGKKALGGIGAIIVLLGYGVIV